MEKESKKAKKYIFWIIVAGIVVLSYLILKSLLIAIITSIVAAYIVKPLHKKLSKKFSVKVSAFITILIFTFAILILLGIIITSFVSQLLKFFSSNNIDILLNYFSIPIIQENLNEIIKRLGEIIISSLPSTLSYIPLIALNIFIITITTYYLLIDWDQIEKKVIDLMPFKNSKQLNPVKPSTLVCNP